MRHRSETQDDGCGLPSVFISSSPDSSPEPLSSPSPDRRVKGAAKSKSGHQGSLNFPGFGKPPFPRGKEMSRRQYGQLHRLDNKLPVIEDRVNGVTCGPVGPQEIKTKISKKAKKFKKKAKKLKQASRSESNMMGEEFGGNATEIERFYNRHADRIEDFIDTLVTPCENCRKDICLPVKKIELLEDEYNYWINRAKKWHLKHELLESEMELLSIELDEAISERCICNNKHPSPTSEIKHKRSSQKSGRKNKKNLDTASNINKAQ